MVNEGKRILILDDDPSIRAVISEVVYLSGMEAVATVEGHDTVARYEHEWVRGNPFDAIILDLNVVGGWGGREALTEIKKINPEVRSLLISGYQDEVEEAAREFGFKYFLTKPFDAMMLLWGIGRIVSEN